MEIINEVIAIGGVDVEPVKSVTVKWFTTGTEAVFEDGGPHEHIGLPGPEQTTGVFELLIYDALVLNACGSFSSFSVEHESTLTESGSEIGSFVGIDNSTRAVVVNVGWVKRSAAQPTINVGRDADSFMPKVVKRQAALVGLVGYGLSP